MWTTNLQNRFGCLVFFFFLDVTIFQQVNAYARARNADPLSSFGDFIGFSGIVRSLLKPILFFQKIVSG